VLAERFADDVRLRRHWTPSADRCARTPVAYGARPVPARRSGTRPSLAGRVRARLHKWALGGSKAGASCVPGPGAHLPAARVPPSGERDRDPSVERLHEWRKRTKDLRYALELLEPTWPPVIDAFEDELHKLTDRLGDRTDLARLEDRVRAAPEACGTSADCTALVGLIDARRAELLADGETDRRARLQREASRLRGPPARLLGRTGTDPERRPDADYAVRDALRRGDYAERSARCCPRAGRTVVPASMIVPTPA
jgi:hypothetical protein